MSLTVRSALVHGLAFVARDTRNHPPRFPLRPFDDGGEIERVRLAEWYRRFVETRSGDSAELVLTTALAEPGAIGDVERMMFAAVTDHVFIDGGHTIDFTNKAFESLGYIGPEGRTRRAPHAGARYRLRDLVGAERHLATSGRPAGADRPDAAPARRRHLRRRHPPRRLHRRRRARVAAPRRAIPGTSSTRSSTRSRPVPIPTQLGRALAYAAALRITRFHVQNDFGDWDTVHHAFTAAHALHCRARAGPHG